MSATATAPKKDVGCDPDSSQDLLESLSFRECLDLLTHTQGPLRLPLLQVLFVDQQSLRVEDWYSSGRDLKLRKRDKADYCYQDVVNSFVLNSFTSEEKALLRFELEERRVCYMIKMDGTRQPLFQRQMAQMLLPLVTLVSVRIVAFQQYVKSKFGGDTFLVCRLKRSDCGGHYASTGLELMNYGKKLGGEAVIGLDPTIQYRVISSSFSHLKLLNEQLKGRVVSTVSFVYLLGPGDNLYLADIVNCRIRCESNKVPSASGDIAGAKVVARRIRRPRSSQNLSVDMIASHMQPSRRSLQMSNNSNNKRYWSGGGQNWKSNRRTFLRKDSASQSQSSHHASARSFDELIVTRYCPAPEPRRRRPYTSSRSGTKKTSAENANNQIVIKLPGSDLLRHQQQNCAAVMEAPADSRRDEGYRPVSRIDVSLEMGPSQRCSVGQIRLSLGTGKKEMKAKSRTYYRRSSASANATISSKRPDAKTFGLRGTKICNESSSMSKLKTIRRAEIPPVLKSRYSRRMAVKL